MTNVLQGVQTVALAGAACAFLACSLRMALMRPMWRTPDGHRVWYTVAVLLFVMVFVTMRDLVDILDDETTSAAAVIIRGMKMVSVTAITWVLFRGDIHHDLPKRD